MTATQNLAGKVFLTIFALPFCGFGLLALVKGLTAAQQGTSQWALIFPGALFSLIGFGLIAAVVFGSRYLAAEQKIQAEHPGEPWLWRDDWSHGRADSKTKSSMLAAWLIASLWMLVSAPILFVIPKEQFEREPKTFFALLFPIAGIFLISWALRQTMRRLEFGKTYFEMPIVPLVVGREARGTIQARFSNIPQNGVTLKLTCIRRITTGSGDNRSTSERILWREEKTLPAEQLIAGPIGTSIPVSFAVPQDAQATDTTNSNDAILWVLEADADVPGVDYKDLFEVPVFRTKDTPTAPQVAAWGSLAISKPAHPTIVVRPSAEGRTEFYFPSARNKGFAFGVTIFSLVWSGAIVLMIALHAPFIFPVFFSLFDALMIFITLDLWMGSSTVIFNQGELRVRSGLVGQGRIQEVPFSEIGEIRSAITSQQGGATGTPYYDIQLIKTDGKKLTLGKTIRDRQEVDWLVAEMKRLAGGRAMAAAGGR